MKKVFKSLNPVRKVCDSLFGSKHSEKHRMITGVSFMFFGVSLSILSHHFSFVFIHFLGDCIGYSLHGAGLVPFIEHYASKAGNEVKEVEKDVKQEYDKIEGN